MTQAQFEHALTEALNREGFARLPEGDGEADELRRADVQDLLHSLSDEIAKALKKRDGGHAVTVRGLGRFRVAKRAARKARDGRNPATGETIRIAAKPASRAVKVRPDALLCEALGIR